MKNSTLLKWFRLALFILFLGITGAAQAQTVTYSCTSKDLFVRKAYFEGFDICNAPTEETDFTVKLRIINKTNSTRNAAAFMGKLYEIDGDGKRTLKAEFTPASTCTPQGYNYLNPALLPSDSVEFSIGKVTFKPGYRYVLTDIVLAWTNASKKADCNTIINDFGSSTTPKCATLDSLEIPVNITPNAEVVGNGATCFNNATASIDVAPYGGTPKYTIQLKADSIGNRLVKTASNTLSTTFENIPVGNYLVLVTDQTPCTDTQKITIAAPGKLTPAPIADETTAPNFCDSGVMYITNITGGFTYYMITGVANKTTIDDPTGFNVPGTSHPRFFAGNGTCYSDTVAYCTPTIRSMAAPSATTLSQKSKSVNNLGSGTIESIISIKAVPNPFGNRVTFMINVPEAGQGRLEIFNIQGQKIKTLYQGYMPAGMNLYELTVSEKRQAELIYVFTKDGQRTTGKLIQMGKQ